MHTSCVIRFGSQIFLSYESINQSMNQPIFFSFFLSSHAYHHTRGLVLFVYSRFHQGGFLRLSLVDLAKDTTVLPSTLNSQQREPNGNTSNSKLSTLPLPE
jgi:hypothetical protein